MTVEFSIDTYSQTEQVQKLESPFVQLEYSGKEDPKAWRNPSFPIRNGDRSDHLHEFRVRKPNFNWAINATNEDYFRALYLSMDVEENEQLLEEVADFNSVIVYANALNNAEQNTHKYAKNPNQLAMQKTVWFDNERGKDPEERKPFYEAVDTGIVYSAESPTDYNDRQLLNEELLWLTKIDISQSLYEQVQKEYEERSPVGRYKDWDFKTYVVYFMNRVANEDRNSVRNNWEADNKGEHAARFYIETRNLPEEERPTYRELDADETINREGM